MFYFIIFLQCKRESAILMLCSTQLWNTSIFAEKKSINCLLFTFKASSRFFIFIVQLLFSIFYLYSIFLIFFFTSISTLISSFFYSNSVSINSCSCSWCKISYCSVSTLFFSTLTSLCMSLIEFSGACVFFLNWSSIFPTPSDLKRHSSFACPSLWYLSPAKIHRLSIFASALLFID